MAYALSQLVDTRIGEHQAKVLEGAQALSADELATLDEVELTGVEPGPPPGGAPADGEAR